MTNYNLDLDNAAAASSSVTAVDAIDQRIITYLTAARIRNYAPAIISTFKMTETDKLKQIVTKLGRKILSVNNPEQGTLQTKLSQFEVVVSDMYKKTGNIYAMTQFAACLLQYHTIVSADEFNADLSLEKFDEFLVVYQAKIGDTSQNLFVAEYRLIALYNGIVALLNDVNEGREPIDKLKAQQEYYLQKLPLITTQIKQWVDASPRHYFVLYLDFVLKYAKALYTELYYGILSKAQRHHSTRAYDEDEENKESDANVVMQYQVQFLKEALSAMDGIPFVDDNIFPDGYIYGFGSDFPSRVNVERREVLRAHIENCINENLTSCHDSARPAQ